MTSENSAAKEYRLLAEGQRLSATLHEILINPDTAMQRRRRVLPICTRAYHRTMRRYVAWVEAYARHG